MGEMLLEQEQRRRKVNKGRRLGSALQMGNDRIAVFILGCRTTLFQFLRAACGWLLRTQARGFCSRCAGVGNQTLELPWVGKGLRRNGYHTLH